MLVTIIYEYKIICSINHAFLMWSLKKKKKREKVKKKKEKNVRHHNNKILYQNLYSIEAIY